MPSLANSNKDNRGKRDQKNKGGRPKGAKNKSTILAEAIKGDFEKSLKANFRDIMQVVIKKAKEGDTGMIKLLFDKVIPNAGSGQEMKKGDMVVQISIGDMQPKQIEGEVIENEG